jgi:hypothetical protein
VEQLAALAMASPQADPREARLRIQSRGREVLHPTEARLLCECDQRYLAAISFFRPFEQFGVLKCLGMVGVSALRRLLRGVG